MQDNKKAAQRAFNFITAPSINQVDNYDIVGDLVSNRVIDSGFEQAINRGSSNDGVFLTIREAIDANLLHGNWQLIPPTHALNSSEARDCYIKAYCYSNIQKLRKALILPIGFELAALKSNPDKPWTLDRVVNGFDDCNENGEPDANHEACHLINPNWIIKVPQSRCGTEGFGPNLVDNSTPFRAEECMDLQTCISESADGTCIAWGYCTKEKNIWQLDGQECPAQYSTCTSYTNTSSGDKASYLARTIDFAQCTPESVGCQGYSTEKLSNEWITYADINSVGSLKTVGRNGSIYFNRNVETCSASSEGCTVFYGVQRNFNTGLFTLKNNEYIRNTSDIIHLKVAPDYLGCYDTNTGAGSETIINWPQTESEILNMNVPSECGKFAQVCAPLEAGCSLYTSARTGSTVSAVVKEQNGCPAECAGYETFKQRESSFEDEEFPLHFVPSLGTVCSAQHVGCDEFTNVEESSEGGERLEYYNYIRFCEKPNTVPEKVFFSWEGSHSEGFVLRNHRLKQMDAGESAYVAGLAGFDWDSDNNGVPDGSSAVDFAPGSPAYSDNTREAIQNNFEVCNRTNYALAIINVFDPNSAAADCRQFYDNAGNEYYRMMGDTVIISDQCRRLRKTEPRLFVDNDIADGTTCANQGNGVWGDSNGDGVSECNRCYAGGQVDGNTCVYQSLSSESSRCPAVANECRAYTGNTGNNLRLNIIADGFESATTTDGWFLLAPSGSNISISSESLQRGQSSLRISNSAGQEYLIREIELGTTEELVSLQSNGWFELSFWARGAPQDISIRFMQDTNSDGAYNYNLADPASETYGIFTHEVLNADALSSISIGNNWREYRLGPVQFTGDGLSPGVLSFHNVGTAAPYFLDNIQLSQIEDSIYLIKDSWQQEIGYDVNGNGTIEEGESIMANAPSTCFASGENPAGLLPGFALGCSEYTDERSNTYYLTGFASLCREEAVGCQPLFDTNNTLTGEDARLPKIYNLVCSHDDGESGVECSINYFGTTGSCFVPQGEPSCYIPVMNLPIDDNGTANDFNDDEYRDLNDLLAFDFGEINISIDLSSVYIPPESGAPIFLTNRTEYHCPEGDVGCTLMGLQDQIMPSTTTLSYEYSDIYIKDNPERYGEILCTQDKIGCGEYTTGPNTYYFRDPVETGHSICTYKENTASFDGWYIEGFGRCQSQPSNYCRSNSDCADNDCSDIGSIPCYDDYLKDEIYSIWSNDSDRYNGFVGSCQNKYNLCTELVDTVDTSNANPNGQPYYRIFDDKLTERTSECNGQVSLKEGCVLFDKTDQPNKFYNASLTYEASDETNPKYGFVNPQISTDPGVANDTNFLLKVNRDRACSEWLTCSNKLISRDEKGEKQVLCSEYKACEKLKIGGRDDECLTFVQPQYGETFLDEERYTGRDISWYGFEYSGYSLLNKHQILTFGYFTFSTEPENQYLGALLPNIGELPNNCDSEFGDTDGNPCGPGLAGRCFVGKCVNKIDGSSFPNINLSGAVDEDEERLIIHNAIRDGLNDSSCKIFSEEGSPFPYLNIASEPVDEEDAAYTANSRIKRNTSAGSQLNGKSRVEYSIYNNFFSEANLCQGSIDCSCEYNKYDYGNFVDYYPITTSTSYVNPSIPIGICTTGEKDGQPCQTNLDCIVREGGEIVSAGECSKLRQVQTRLGVKGFCLEPDFSRPINGKARYEADQEYACLTWLPIQTSATNIDPNSLHIEAGYYPQLDANPNFASGELYCAGVSGGGLFDADYILDPSVGYDYNDFNDDELNETTSHFSSQVLYSYFPDPVVPVNGRSLHHFTCQTFPSQNYNYGYGFGPVSTSNRITLLSMQTPFGYSGGGTVTFSTFNKLMCNYREENLNDNDIDSVLGFYMRPMAPDDSGITGTFPNPGQFYAGIPWKTVRRMEMDNLGAFIIKLFTSYAWNRIGNNAIPLRVEYNPNKDLDLNGTTAPWRFAPWVGGNPGVDIYEIQNGGFDRRTHPVDLDTDDDGVVNDTSEYGGLYNFNTADNFINEYSVNDFYFIPTVYKGTLRGAVPRTILDLGDPNMSNWTERWDNEVLRLPIKALASNDGNINGSIVPFSGVVIRKDSDYYTDSDYFNNSGYGYYIVNFSLRNKTSIYYGDPMTFSKTDPVSFSQNHLLMWRYVLDRNNSDQSSLFYPDEPDVVKKYILVFFANQTSGALKYDSSDPFGYRTVAPMFMNGILSEGQPEPFVPQSAVNDPFQTDCQRGYVGGGYSNDNEENAHYNPWWAVSVNFGENGEFLGYTTKWCNGYTADNVLTHNENASLGSGIGFAVFADLATQCREIVQVYDRSAFGTARTINKAWTNRVWSLARNIDGTPFAHPFARDATIDQESFGTDDTSSYPLVSRNNILAPYGSLGLSADFLSDLDNTTLLNFSFQDPFVDGIPYSCNLSYADALVRSVPLNLYIRSCPFAPYESTIYRNTFAFRQTVGQEYNGSRVVSTIGRMQVYDPVYYLMPWYAHDALFELFVKQFRVVNLDEAGANPGLQYVDAVLPLADLDRSNTIYGAQTIIRRPAHQPCEFCEPIPEYSFTEYLTQPAVYSLNPVFCSEDDDVNEGADCTVAEYNSFSVGLATGELKDYNNDGQISSVERSAASDIASVDTYTANVKFFAHADDNRMPIRKVSVDWGDGSTITNENKLGLYKNSKPFCANGGNGDEVVPVCKMNFQGKHIPSSITCEEDSDCPENFNVVEPLSIIEAGDDPLLTNPDCMSTQELLALGGTDLETYAMPRFGNAPRACTIEPFEFEHAYRCTATMIDAHITFGSLDSDVQSIILNEVTNYNLSVDIADQINLSSNDVDYTLCQFKPRVQVLDNWGYCNGWCPDDPANPEAGGPFCYSGDVATECAWRDVGSVPPILGVVPTPWTTYRGNIIIIPSEEF
ncbi:MAG: hypothetical protein A3F93_00100 [Candidatus Magasanikbacteria bacterium RIFCSPLOWO2_12_FULL_34_7]|nr:MAG: hypothetical protein A3F93_00100 [Candidatus Magasanikbacteria bacterium RIFCSPLOWO2_12_FULL_34_7]